MGAALGVVQRCITSHLVGKAGLTRERARTGAVTLVQRFGGALNLNVHFHMLLLDGVHVERPDGALRFRRIGAVEHCHERRAQRARFAKRVDDQQLRAGRVRGAREGALGQRPDRRLVARALVPDDDRLVDRRQPVDEQEVRRQQRRQRVESRPPQLEQDVPLAARRVTLLVPPEVRRALADGNAVVLPGLERLREVRDGRRLESAGAEEFGRAKRVEPVSSRASRSAASAGSSPGSIVPPGTSGRGSGCST